MYSFNNTTTTRAVFQHNVDNFDFQKIESELTSILAKSDSGFFPVNLSPTSSQYYDMWSTSADFFKPQFICNNSNEFVQKTSTPAPSTSEQVRALIKKSNTIITTSETKTEIIKQTPNVVNHSVSKPKIVDELEKPKHISKKNRQLPLRSKNIDLSSYLNRNKLDSIESSTSLNSLANSSSSSETSSVSPLNSPTRTQGRVQICNSKNQIQICSFCQNNGESEEIYTSHPLKDSLSRIVCPILRNFTCPRCGESGDYAHTNKYCPHTQRKAKADKIKNALNC